MAMKPIYKPEGEAPIAAAINGMFVGKTVNVFGKISEKADRFMVNLMCGNDIAVSDIALHINPRFPVEQVVRNTRVDGVWGEEERAGPFPFKKGDHFSIKITCTESHFLIGANDDESFAKYEHRVPFTSITHVNVGQDCKAILLNSETKDVVAPAVTIDNPRLGNHRIPFYNACGRKIQIAGFPTKEGGNFIMDVITSDVALVLHYRPYMDQNQIQLGAMTSDRAWGPFEYVYKDHFPFYKDAPFQTTIEIKENEFIVDINGVQAFTFPNRIPGGISKISELGIYEDVELKRITYF